MAEATFTLSAFGDEIAPPLEEQLRVLQSLDVGCLELRGVWGKNVLRLEDDDVERVVKVCDEYNTSVACIGSPIGKSPITEPIDMELNNLARIMEIGEAVGCRRVRMFSFYPPDTSTNEHYDQYVEPSVERLTKLAEAAAREGFTLMLENEKAIVGDTIARCHALVTGVDNDHLRFLWDPANFIQVGEAQPTETGWSLLGEYIGYVHIKDAQLADGKVKPAGKGDGQVPELLAKLKGAGYQGILALEPHLVVAGHSSGFSGADGMKLAVESLREVMAEVGCKEVQAP
jgi:sugar phosphate isomerase/epimerase